MPPSARITDMHTCPLPTHVGGPVNVGEPTVLIGNVPAARISDSLVCACGLDIVSQGEATVLIGNLAAARLGDATGHGGVLAQGDPTVLIGSTAQSEALATDKPFCEECERALQPAEHRGWPPVLIDAHMHIQSGNCAPLPPVRALILNIRLGRGVIGWLGRAFLGEFGDFAAEPTHVIGDRLVAHNEGLRDLMQGEGAYFLGMSVVLTMDMDYCHVDGYKGEHVYYEDEEGDRYYLKRRKRRSGAAHQDEPWPPPPTRRDRVYVDRREDAPMDLEEGEAADPDDRVLEDYTRDLRSAMYETWRQQRRRTEMACVRHPLRLLPMYHYEPRRYISETPPAQPYEQLVEGGGLYVGFKMYTSLGYMPDDTSEAGAKVQAITRDLFSQCAAHDIPVMTHCTPSGFYTHQRELYIELASPAKRDEYRGADGKLEDRWRLKYFQDHCVHPEAWRPVLAQNPSLRLCLAHWASDSQVWLDEVADFRKPPLTMVQLHEVDRQIDQHRRDAMILSEPLPSRAEVLLDMFRHGDPFPGCARPCIDDNGALYGKGWVRSIVELCGAHPNFFTDISFLALFKEVRRPGGEKFQIWEVVADILAEFPYMVDHIMFGSDWYMILNAKYEYREWFVKTKECLQQIQARLGGAWAEHDIFHQWAITNPIRFYRLPKIAQKLKDNLAGRIDREPGVDHAALHRDLERRWQVLSAAVDEGRLAAMEAAIKAGPIGFSPPSGWLP